jgi:ferrous iron transport protein A
MEKIINLSDLKPGDEATIHEMQNGASDNGRLRELGLSDGTPIRVIKLAPLGDPMEIKFRGYHLSIRKSMARRIRVCCRVRGCHGERG